MANSESEVQSNPEIGMQSESLEQAEVASNNSVQGIPETGSDDFFNQLDEQVNGQIKDVPEATPKQTSGPDMATHEILNKGSNTQDTQSTDSTDWAKRYKDSSREAVKWRDRYREVEKFVPVLEAMKNDSGLVTHVRTYLENGGPPAQSIQEELSLDEDFVYDQHEAMTDPASDSAKVMNAHVEKLVTQRVGSMVQQEKKRAGQAQAVRARKEEEDQFKKKHAMSDEDFVQFKAKAQSHKMTLDDINQIVNKDQVTANVLQSSKQDMLNQMKNVRNMPTSLSGANSQGDKNITQDREVFENILGFKDEVDNLFG